MFSRWLARLTTTTPRRRDQRSAGICRDSVENLEDRVVLYATTGNAWPDPRVVTISFEPDGTNLGGVSSNLNSTFNSNPNLVGWQNEILRAAQVWAQQTNINFVVVSDNGGATGSGSYQQGAPTMGDIRIGGYSFGNSTLAMAYQPPPVNNFSVAGDIMFNTDQAFGIGAGYDLFTVATHEIGHALGLDHSTDYTSEMFSTYNGIKPNLTTDDISGIRAVYSSGAARTADSYDRAGSNSTMATASSIDASLVKADKDAIVTGLDITSTSDVDYYSVTIPRWADTTITAKVQSTGLSMLSPKLTVYASDGTVLGTASSSAYGATLSVTLNNIANKDVLYFRVEGSTTSTAFGTGAYALTLDLGGAGSPVVPLPNTTLANGSPLHAGGGQALVPFDGTNDTTAPAAPTIAVAVANKSVVVSGTAEADSIVTIYSAGTAVGSVVAGDDGVWSWTASSSLENGTYTLSATATDLSGNVSGSSSVVSVIVKHKRR